MSTPGAPLSAQLPRDLSSSGVARDLLRDWLAPTAASSERVSDILLGLSELVTNAITHGGSAPVIAARLVGGRLVHVEISDNSAEQPQERAFGTLGGGFGLRLVDAVASSWGWSATATGKVVWADFELG